MKVDKPTVLFKLHFCAEYYILSRVMVICSTPALYSGGPTFRCKLKTGCFDQGYFSLIHPDSCWESILNQVTSVFFHILCSYPLPFSILSC